MKTVKLSLMEKIRFYKDELSPVVPLVWNTDIPKKKLATIDKEKHSVYLNTFSSGIMMLSALASNDDISKGIQEAFEPVTELLSGLSYPVCYIMISTGLLLMMSGNKTKGIDIIKWASISFLGLQFLPQVMKMLAEVGDAMSRGN